MSIFGATGTPVLDFWWHLLWVSKPEWAMPYSHCRGKHNVCSPRSTSSTTLADLLVAGAQSVLSPHEVRLPGFELVLSEYLWARRSTNWAKPGPAILSKSFLTAVLFHVELKPAQPSRWLLSHFLISLRATAIGWSSEDTLTWSHHPHPITRSQGLLSTPERSHDKWRFGLFPLLSPPLSTLGLFPLLMWSV